MLWFVVGGIITEATKLKHLGLVRYVRDRWFISHVTRSAAFVIVALCRFSESPNSDLLYSSAMAVAIFMTWTRVIEWLKISQQMGAMLIAIRELVDTIVLFSVIFMTFLVSLAIGLQLCAALLHSLACPHSVSLLLRSLLYPEQDETLTDYGSFGQVLLSMFQASLGNFSFDDLASLSFARLVLARIILSFVILGGYMVLLNLLVVRSP